MSEKIIDICKRRREYSYPDTHIWKHELFEAINEVYIGCLSTKHYSEQINILADIIAQLAAERTGES